MRKTECFKIQILIYESSMWKPIFQIFCDRAKVIKEPVIIAADPFLFVHHDILYLFYEQKKLYHDGTIMMTCTDDLHNWSKPTEVLREPFHLSYPWVFENDGHIYMLPETCATQSVRLYEASNSELTEFVFIQNLLEQGPDEDIQTSYSDSSLVKKNGKYYLYTTVMREGVNQLLLYYADNLTGFYKEHPKSPVCISQKYGRNAGSLIEIGGGLYRVAQDCTEHYGDNVHILKVLELSEKDYREEVVRKNIFNTREHFYREGGHQLNMAEFGGFQVIAVDAKEYHYYILSHVLHRFGFYKSD